MWLKKADKLPLQTIVAGWFNLTAKACARGLRRTTANRARYEREAAKMNEVSPKNATDEAAWQDIAPCIDDVLETLPVAQREAVLLRYFWGLSQVEAARELKCEEETLHSRVRLGLQKTREGLQRRGIAV